MNEVILFASDRGDTQVRRSIFKGIERVDVRQFMDIENERSPTKKGVSIPLDRLPDLIAALQTVAK